MKWSFRKSISLGPVKVNFSRSGIGGSIGVKGFRKGVDARGRSYTHTSIPGTGIYSRTYDKSDKGGSSEFDPPSPSHRLSDGKVAALIISSVIFFALWILGESFWFAVFIATPALVACWWYSSKQSSPSPEQAAAERERAAAEDKRLQTTSDAIDDFDDAYAKDDFSKALQIYERVPKEDLDLILDLHFEKVMNVLLNDPKYWEHGETLCRYKLVDNPESYTATVWAAIFAGHLKKLDVVNERLQPLLKAKSQEVMQIKHVIEYTYAICLLKCGREKEALRYFKSADKRYPGYKDTASYIEQLGKASGRKRADSGDPKPQAKDPFVVLGLSSIADRATIEQAYRKLISQYHPDRVATLGEELQKLALEKSKEINWAYDECLKRARAA